MAASRTYKHDLIKRMGGEAQYDMAVYELCDRIIRDRKLCQIYEHFDIENLLAMHKDMLDFAFLEATEIDDHLETRVMLHHFRLFEFGLGGEHFDIVKKHLVEALRDTWVDEDTVSDSRALFESLRHLFGGNDFDLPPNQATKVAGRSGLGKMIATI